jgi:hypothetical protein
MSNDAKLREVLDQVAAGRTTNLTCPFCDSGTLKMEPGDYGPELKCPTCKRFIEVPNLDY